MALKEYEEALMNDGISYIAGIDEVGRGPLIGPVVAACIVLPNDFQLEGLTDSKKLSEKKRNAFYPILLEHALGYGIGIVDAQRIDEINIYAATKEAMQQAYEECKKMCKIEHVLIDAMPLTLDVPSTSIIKGDAKSLTIAAASVVAKVTRDRMMEELDDVHPEYGFAKHKGYGTAEHIAAIKKYGLCPIHRLSFTKNFR